MTRDASIDDFTGRDDGTDAGDEGDLTDSDAELADEADAAAHVTGVSPAVSTSRVAPGGDACAACGAVVERLWVADDDGEVCAACKPW